MVGPERFELSAFGEDRSKTGLSSFETFCSVDLQLADSTASRYAREVERFFDFIEKTEDITREDIRGYLAKFKEISNYAQGNVLRPLKIYFRDFLEKPTLVQSFRFPKKTVKVRTVPTREEIQRFYQVLETTKEKALFLMYATTGLRRNEILSLMIADLDFQKRAVTPRKEQSQTKHTWIAFYNDEAEDALKKYLAERNDSNPKLFPMRRDNFCKIWRSAKEKSGFHITPQTLRVWFATEMAKLKVPDRYVDAFCGRVPMSILAKHYSDYSPETLEEIYDGAGLRVLS